MKNATRVWPRVSSFCAGGVFAAAGLVVASTAVAKSPCDGRLDNFVKPGKGLSASITDFCRGSSTKDFEDPPSPPPMSNRITTPTDPAARCNNVGVAPDTCVRRREYALSKNCINRAEFDALARFGGFPMCDFDETNPAKMLSGWCSCGCFSQDVNILTANNGSFQWTKAGSIAEKWSSTLMASLNIESRSDSYSFAIKKLRLATKGSEEKPNYVIHTEYGYGLQLTSEHPVLLATGKMIQARKLRKGDKLVGIDGLQKTISEITRVKSLSDVVNFAVEAESKVGHVIAAEGVLVGDLVWQGTLMDEEKAIEIRN